jgi:hypothetical protein
MFNRSILFKLLFIVLPLQAFCIDRFMVPFKIENQQEIYIQGGLALQSEKTNTVLFYQTTELLQDGKGNFYFVISNQTPNYINFFPHNVRVTDQFGRPIRIVPIQEHLDRIRTTANWKTVFAVVGGGLQLFNAQSAGRIDYSRAVHHNSFGQSHSFNRRTGHTYNDYRHHQDTYEHGTIHCEALRRAAEREALLEMSISNCAIKDEFQMRKARYENFYLSSNTIFPRAVYSANFQIDVPKYIQLDLQHLYFHFDVQGQTHTFCIYCGDRAR